MLAGFLGGAVDTVLAGLLDLLWAFPVYLLAISLSIILITEGLRLGPLTISADSLALPILILGLVFVPYVARPVRAQVIALRQDEFVQAAVSIGGGTRPHPAPAHHADGVAHRARLRADRRGDDLLTEAALSVLGIGVQPPDASWGTLIGDGQNLIYSRPLVAVAPGLAVVAHRAGAQHAGRGLGPGAAWLSCSAGCCGPG